MSPELSSAGNATADPSAPVTPDPAQYPTPGERTQARPSKGYIPTLDGWRAIAIIWVIYAHLGRHPGSPGTGFEHFTHAIADWGDHGVQLFFALSGYLICTRLLREEKTYGGISLKSFYVRRLFRIQPPAIAYLAFLSLLTLIGVIQPYWKGIFAALFMVRNIWPAQVDHRFWYTSHFWSLSVEEHFYLMLPAFLVFVRRWRLRLLVVAVLGLDVWRAVVFSHPALQHFGWMVDLRTDVLLGNIVIGSLFAVALTRPEIRAWAQRWLRPWVALLYTAAVMTAFTLHLRRFEYQMVITTYPVLLVATSFHPNTPFSRFLELRWMRFLGRISFSLYIWQQFFMWPVIWTPELWLFRHPSLCLLLLLPVATASYYWVELPLVRVGHRLALRYDRPRLTDPDASAA